MSWRAATWADMFAVVSGWSATLGPLPADTKGDISSLEEQISTLRSFGDSWMLLVTGECLTPHSHPKVSQHSLRSFCLYFYYFIHYCLSLIVLMLIHYILSSFLFSPDWYILSISSYSTLSTSPLHLCHNYNTPALIAEATVNPYSSHKLYSVVDFAILSIFLTRTQFIVLSDCWKYSPVCQMVSPVTDMYKNIAHCSSSVTYFKSITPKEHSVKMSLWNSPSSQWMQSWCQLKSSPTHISPKRVNIWYGSGSVGVNIIANSAVIIMRQLATIFCMCCATVCLIAHNSCSLWRGRGMTLESESYWMN